MVSMLVSRYLCLIIVCCTVHFYFNFYIVNTFLMKIKYVVVYMGFQNSQFGVACLRRSKPSFGMVGFILFSLEEMLFAVYKKV